MIISLAAMRQRLYKKRTASFLKTEKGERAGEVLDAAPNHPSPHHPTPVWLSTTTAPAEGEQPPEKGHSSSHPSLQGPGLTPLWIHPSPCLAPLPVPGVVSSKCWFQPGLGKQQSTFCRVRQGLLQLGWGSRGSELRGQGGCHL